MNSAETNTCHLVFRLLSIILGVILLILPPLMSRAIGASAVGGGAPVQAPFEPSRPIPIGQAVDRLAKALNAQIVIMDKLGEEQVVLNPANRSATENLKSILKGYSYAIIFGEPLHAYRSLEHAPSAAGVPLSTGAENTPQEAADRPPIVYERDRLVSRIDRLQEQIHSGAADRFYERWSRFKDPKFIYNHRKDLERLRKKLSTFDSRSAIDDVALDLAEETRRPSRN